jgi:hypothetical protein
MRQRGCAKFPLPNLVGGNCAPEIAYEFFEKVRETDSAVDPTTPREGRQRERNDEVNPV